MLVWATLGPIHYTSLEFVASANAFYSGTEYGHDAKYRLQTLSASYGEGLADSVSSRHIGALYIEQWQGNGSHAWPL